MAVVVSGLGEPTRIPGLSDAVAVSAGDEHVCVVHADGGVSCWGGNFYGRLGDGTRQSRNWPYRIPGLSDVTAIGAARSHSCAVHSDGTISCWGLNYRGQLGDGTTSRRHSPVNVHGIADAVSVALSSRHTCAVQRSGRVSCWGSNSDSYYDHENRGFVDRTGILGTGSRRSRELLPAPVQGINDAVAVAVGDGSSCALHRDATYPRCESGGEEAIADAMMHLVFPDAPLSYYGADSSCRGMPEAPSEQDKAVLGRGLAGQVPQWFTENVTSGAALWRMWVDAGFGHLAMLANLMGEFGGLCRTDFLMNWTIAPTREENPFKDGGC